MKHSPADVVLLRGLIADLRRHANQCNAVALLLEQYLTAPPQAPLASRSPFPPLVVNSPDVRRMLPMRDVCARTGLGRTTIYKLIEQKSFPQPVPLTAGRVGWPIDAVDRWLAMRGEKEPSGPVRRRRS